MTSHYLTWWYGVGLVQAFNVCNALIFQLAYTFSLARLVRTWFSPWKDDLNGQIGSDNLIGRLQSNLVSRLVGFFVRTATIVVGLILIVILTAALAVGLLIWLLVPLSIFILPVLATMVLIYG